MAPANNLVIACDWSSAQGRKPRPQEDRCWLAWGGHNPASRSEPCYMPTRLEAEARIGELLTDHPGPAIVGVDFAIGYPVFAPEGGEPVPLLPVGRDLCRMLAERVTDDPSGVNNRFEVADALNREIESRTGFAGPFWGRPRELTSLRALPERRPDRPTGFSQHRACELVAQRETKSRPQSAWKCSGIGSVGGQSLVGMPMVHRLLTDPALAARARLWPFDEVTDRDDAIMICEIYPSMFPERSPTYWYKDARQVVDTRDAILDGIADGSITLDVEHPAARVEGWILGVPG